MTTLNISTQAIPGQKSLLRRRVALVQRFVPHYNLVFYKKLLARSRHCWSFIYGSYPGAGESGLATDAEYQLPTRRIKNIPIGSAIWQRGVVDELRSQRFDAVVFELGWQIVSNPWLIANAHRCGIKVIPWTKGIAESGRRRSFLRRSLEKCFIRRCDAILAYGKVSSEYFQDYGYPANRIFVAQNTVDVRTIANGLVYDREAASGIRQKHGLGGAVVIGYLGRLVQQKRVDRIIHAFSEFLIQEQQSPSYLLIAGDGPERAALESWARELGVINRTIFVGRVPEEELGAYFQTFDIVVSAFGAGLSILETMAHCKINLITPEVRPETELIIDGKTGIIAKDFTMELLAIGMARAVQAVAEGNSIGIAAQAEVLAHATSEKMIEAFDDAVDMSLISSSS